jgi:hypothetical protein
MILGIPNEAFVEVAKQVPYAFIFLVLGVLLIWLTNKTQNKLIDNHTEALGNVHDRIDDAVKHSAKLEGQNEQIIQVVTQTNQLVIAHLLKEAPPTSGKNVHAFNKANK